MKYFNSQSKKAQTCRGETQDFCEGSAALYGPETWAMKAVECCFILGPSNDFTLLNGWICLHGVLD